MMEVLLNRSKLGISASAQRVLREQEIDDDGPGTVLADFETLLQFIGQDGLKTTGKYYLLPQGKLDALNLQMSRPVVHSLKRPQQRSFPNLHGLYLMLRSSGMGIGEGAPPAGRLVLDQEIVMSWRGLNPTERYFALLESWLVQGAAELITERGGWASSFMRSLTDLAWRLRERRTVAVHRGRGGLLNDVMEATTAALMELFGWVRLEFAEPAAGEGVKITAIERTDFGDAMVGLLNRGYLDRQWPIFDDETPAEPGVLRPLFQPYFPEYQRAMETKELPYQDGTFVMRVSVGDAWRRISAPDDATLDALAHTIIEAFDFDLDHLYCFELRQPNGRRLRIACPYESEAAAFTDDFTLGELPIAEGGTMTMIFDYGDNWRFHVKLEEIRPAAKSTRPKVIAEGGKAPAQYPYDDEDC